MQRCSLVSRQKLNALQESGFKYQYRLIWDLQTKLIKLRIPDINGGINSFIVGLDNVQFPPVILSQSSLLARLVEIGRVGYVDDLKLEETRLSGTIICLKK